VATIKIKKGDTVQVITGKDKGKEGKVIAVKDGKVLVEGVNTITKHTKASQSNPKGGIVHQEAAIDVSNVMYVNKGKVTRIGFKLDGDKKVRVAKTTGEVID
jgi:ribosomal protein L24, bacterial/organelle